MGLSGKEPACQHRRLGFDPRVRKIPWRREWQPVISAGKSHGERSLIGYSPWGWKRVRHDFVTKKQHKIMFEVNGDPQIITIQIILAIYNPIGTKFS